MQAYKDKFFTRYPLQNLQNVINKPTSFIPAKAIFKEDAYFDEDNTKIAELYFLNELPVLKFYTANPMLKAKAQAKLTAKYMVDLYVDFIQFLSPAARVKSGHYATNPIQFVSEEIRRRQLDLSYVEVELHFMLLEFNAYIAEQNTRALPGLSLTPFTMDDLKAFLCLCDVYKGIGCSAALRKTNEGLEFIRLVDWQPLSVLGNHTLGLMSYTGHEDPEKPQMVFSVGFTPGILGLSMVNDKGLIITLNEATKMDTKRENPNPKAIPQFILVRQLIENCSTIAEVKEYLKTHQPATSHILSIMDAKDNFGIFEMLPNKGPYSKELYHFRSPSLETNSVHVSNHFLDDQDKSIFGSEGFDCSFDRFNRMNTALEKNEDAYHIAYSTNVHDSIQTLIFTKNDKGLFLDLNWSNAYSSSKIAMPKAKINIQEEFALYANCKLPKTKIPLEMPEVHHTLIKLMKASHELGFEHPRLGYYLNDYYSELVKDLAINPDNEVYCINGANSMLKKANKVQINSYQRQTNHQIVTPAFLVTLPFFLKFLPWEATIGILFMALLYNNRESLTFKSKRIVLWEKIEAEIEQISKEDKQTPLNMTM